MNIQRLVITLALLSAVSPVLAQAPFPIARVVNARFSDAGRTLVAGSISGHYVSDNGGSGANWSVALSPSAAYFLRDRIGLGIAPSFTRGKDSAGFDYREAALGVYGIFDVPIAARVSLLVIPTLAYAYREETARHFELSSLVTIPNGPANVGISVETTSRQSLRLMVQLPFVYHASSSIVLGLGPFFAYERLVRVPTSDSVGDGTGNLTHSPFLPLRNTFHIGVSSFIGASF